MQQFLIQKFVILFNMPKVFLYCTNPFSKGKKNLVCYNTEGNQEHLVQILFDSMDLQRKAKHRHQSCKRVDQIPRAPGPVQELEEQKLYALHLFRENFSGLNMEIIRMGATITLPSVVKMLCKFTWK